MIFLINFNNNETNYLNILIKFLKKIVFTHYDHVHDNDITVTQAS